MPMEQLPPERNLLPFWTFPIDGRPACVLADGVTVDQLTFTLKG